MTTTIVKGTRDCNLRCKYCYTGIGSEDGVMEYLALETAEQYLVDLKEFEMSDRKVSEIISHLIWHGGEPLLLGLDFYKEIVAIQDALKEDGFRFENSVQTNGTLYDEEWHEFFKLNDFSVGISLDGPKHLNDKTRVYADGSSTFNDVMRAVTILKKDKRPGAIAVITSENIDHLDEVVEFFKEYDMGVKLNPLIPTGDANNHLDLSITPAKYGKNMSILFKRWFSDAGENYARIDTFKDIIKSMVEAKPYGCNHNPTCQDSFISLAPNGDLYPCGRFDGVSEYLLGNVADSNLRKVFYGPIRQQLKERYDNLKTCHSCDISDLCHGGCMHNALVAGDIMGKDPMCASNKLLFGAVKNELKRYALSIGGIYNGDKGTANSG